MGALYFVKKLIKYAYLSLSIMLTYLNAYTQSVSINSDGSAPDGSSILDISSSDKGILIPRVALSGKDDSTTILSPETSLLVYNTSSDGVGANAVIPGFYYYDGIYWTKLNFSSTMESAEVYGVNFRHTANFNTHNSGSPIIINSFTTGVANTALSLEVYNTTTYSSNYNVNPDAAQIISDAINTSWHSQGFTNSFCYTSLRANGNYIYIALFALNPPDDVRFYHSYAPGFMDGDFDYQPKLSYYQFLPSSVNSNTENIDLFNKIADITFNPYISYNSDNIDMTWLDKQTIRRISDVSGLSTSVKNEVMDQLISLGAVSGTKYLDITSGSSYDTNKADSLTSLGWIVY